MNQYNLFERPEVSKKSERIKLVYNMVQSVMEMFPNLRGRKYVNQLVRKVWAMYGDDVSVESILRHGRTIRKDYMDVTEDQDYFDSQSSYKNTFA